MTSQTPAREPDHPQGRTDRLYVPRARVQPRAPKVLWWLLLLSGVVAMVGAIGSSVSVNLPIEAVPWVFRAIPALQMAILVLIVVVSGRPNSARPVVVISLGVLGLAMQLFHRMTTIDGHSGPAWMWVERGGLIGIIAVGVALAVWTYVHSHRGVPVTRNGTTTPTSVAPALPDEPPPTPAPADHEDSPSTTSTADTYEVGPVSTSPGGAYEVSAITHRADTRPWGSYAALVVSVVTMLVGAFGAALTPEADPPHGLPLVFRLVPALQMLIIGVGAAVIGWPRMHIGKRLVVPVLGLAALGFQQFHLQGLPDEMLPSLAWEWTERIGSIAIILFGVLGPALDHARRT